MTQDNHLPAAAPEPLTSADYEEVLADHRRLVRQLDVLLNGAAGAAAQASLADLVAQVEREGLRAGAAAPVAADVPSESAKSAGDAGDLPGELPLTARLVKRESRSEWELELRGTVDNRPFCVIHTEPLSTPLHAVCGLPTLYAHNGMQECAQLKTKLHSILYRVLQDYVIPEDDINAVEFDAIFSRYSWEQLEQEWVTREAQESGSAQPGASRG